MSAASGTLPSGRALPPPLPPASRRCQQAHRQRPAALPEAAAAAPGAAAAGLASLHSQPSGTSCPAAVAGPVSAPLPARLFHRPGCTPRSRRLAPAVAAHSAADAHDTAAAPAPLQTQSDKQQQQHQQQHHHQQQHVSGVAAAAGMQEQEQHSPLEAPRAQQQAGSAQPPAAGPGKQGGQEEHEAKELNKAICAAQSHNDLLGLVGARLTDFSLVNAVTAFHRLAKHSSGLRGAQQTAVQRHPVTLALSTRLEGFAGGLDDLQAAQVLWAHAQLRHGSRALVDSLYSRLGQAVVPGTSGEGGGSAGSGAPAGARRHWQRRTGAPLRLQSLNAVVMLCYAQAKLGRPVRPLLAQLAAALLAAPEQPAAGAVCEGSPGLPAASLSDGLGALSGRSLCLLLWSLASVGVLPPALLLRGTRELRRRGLGDLSVHSMCLVITAQELCWQPAGAAGATHAATSSGGVTGGAVGSGSSGDGDGEGQPLSAQQAASEVAAPGPAAAMPGCWDQAFMDALAAELAQRSRSRRSGFWLNGHDCCTLARGCALTWQAALGGSGGGSGGVLEGPLENRLMLREEVQRHVQRCRHRAALVRLLASAARAQAPRLGTRGVTSLAWSLTFLLRPGPDSPLLDALALRAVELGRQQQLDAQAVASLAWSFSTLRYDHPQLYEGLAHAVLCMLGRDGGAGGMDSEAGSSSGSSSSSGGIASSSDSGAGRGSSSSSGGASSDAHSRGAALDRAVSGVRSLAGGGEPGHGSSQAGGSAFVPHTVSVLVFAFAAANRFDSPTQRKMMEALAELAGGLLLSFTPQGLANLAWGLTVAGIYPPQLIRRWRAVAGAERRLFRPAELNQLHLVEVALRLEAPPGAVQGTLPADAASFFDSLYHAGRLRAFAGRAWARHQESAQPVVSDFQQQVYRTICSLGVRCQLEHSAAGEYSIDVAIPEHRIAVEADGPVHFAVNSRHPTGSTALKRRLLRRLGWRPVDVPYYDWWGLDARGQRDYMRRKLREAGLELPDLPVEAEAEGSRQQQQQQQQQRGPGGRAPARQSRQRQQQQRRRVEQPGRGAFADQLDTQLEARKQAAPLSGPAGGRQQQQQQQAHVPAGAAQAERPEQPSVESAIDQQQVQQAAAAGGQGPQQQQQQESGEASGQAGASGGEPSPSSPSTLAQRAQRLSILQYQRGKLSKQGLVARRGLQAAAGVGQGSKHEGDAEDAPAGGRQQ